MHPVESIVAIGLKLQQNGMVAATDGNISVRCDDHSFYITASGKRKDELLPDDVVQLDFQCNLREGSHKPSTEAKIHAALYEARPNVGAVIHAHPVYATAFSASHFSLDVPIFPEVILSLGRIPLCKYATPSTAQLPESLKPYIEFANVFLLENHGAISVGSTIEEAYNRMEKLEHYAKIMSVLIPLGGAKRIKKKKIAQLYEKAAQVYNINLHPKNRY